VVVPAGGEAEFVGGARSSGGRGAGELHGDIVAAKRISAALPLGIGSGGLEGAGIIT
jgi:hypothetical protein